MAYELNGKDLVTVEQILARYLWNQDNAPSTAEKIDDKWIRNSEDLGDPIIIDANEYMQQGGGRFVSAYEFKMFREFFSKELKAGSYGFVEMWNMLKPEEEQIKFGDIISLNAALKQLTKSVSQYTTGIGSNDFVTRAFVFGSTSFTFDYKSIQFIVNPDGTKELRGLKIYPLEDNFDFEGGTWYADIFNFINQNIIDIDPNHIGRKVPIKFSGEVPSINITDKEFNELAFQRSFLSQHDEQHKKSLSNYASIIEDAILHSLSIRFYDERGRKIIYDSINKYNNGTLVAVAADKPGMNFFSKPGSVLIGGGGLDKLIGCDGDDLLMGASSYALEQDILMGEDGYDTYIADQNDIIIDSDADGEVFLKKFFKNDESVTSDKYVPISNSNTCGSGGIVKLKGGVHHKNDEKHTYYGGGRKYFWNKQDRQLIIDDGLIIENYKNGDLGIRLTSKNNLRPNMDEAEKTQSPIVIDMNGDGVKTVAKGGHVYFDHDGNGFAENTGWVDSNDALLVLDRNQNGLIDNGGELFGSNTMLASGEKAKNGFEALAEYDENQDGIINKNDSIWSKLQLWQDKNQNGLVDDDELTFLSDSQITSINVSYQNKNKTDEHGNVHRESGQVTWADGHQTDATDVWFNTEQSDTYQNDNLQIDKDIAHLPYIEGFGNVPDLHYAMQKDPVLKEMVKSYLAADNASRDTMLNDIIYQWTGSNMVDSSSRGEHIDARKLASLEKLTGSHYVGVWCDGSPDPNPHKKAAPKLLKEYNDFAEYVSASLLAEGVYKELFFPIILAQWSEEKQDIHYDFSKFNNEIDKLVKSNQLERAEELLKISKNLGKYNTEAQNRWLNNIFEVISMDDILADFYREKGNIILGKDSNDTLNGGNGGDILNGGAGNDTLNGDGGYDILIGGGGNDILKGGYWHKDRYEFEAGHGHDVIDDVGYENINSMNEVVFKGANLADAEFIRSGNDLIIRAYGSEDSLRLPDYFRSDMYTRSFNLIFDDQNITAAYLKKNYTFIQTGNEKDNVILGWYSNDILNGGAGNDTLKGYDGDDILNGDDGDDVLYGGEGNDILNGGAGNDTLNGDGGYDILIGGGGNDILKGGYWHKDRYEFEAGHGHDVIDDIGYNGINDLNDVVFKGANLADAELIRSGNDLIIHAYGSEDSVRLLDYFKYNSNTTSFKFIFDDQSITEVDVIKNYTFSQTGDENNNQIGGWYGNDILNGGAGDDKLWGGNGNDIVNGEDGDDVLYGGIGDDILNGGTGNDTLYGGAGNDTYIFAKNHGQDSIKDDHANNANGNKIVLQDFNSDELWFSQNGNNLIINHIGTDDQINVENWFYSETYRQFTITTADNKAITAGQVQKLLTAMAGFTVNTEANISSAGQMHSFVQQGNIAAYWGN